MSGGRGRGGQGGLELSDLGGGSGVRANEVPGTNALRGVQADERRIARTFPRKNADYETNLLALP